MIHHLLRAGLLALATTCPSWAQSAQADWAYFKLGNEVGRAGLQVSTANGVTEVVVSAGSTSSQRYDRYWLLLQHSPSDGSYQQSFVSPIYQSSQQLVAIRVADIDPASGPEIVVARWDGVVEIWNQAQRRKLRQFTTDSPYAVDMEIADVEVDGSTEILLLQHNTLRAYDPDGTLEWTRIGLGQEDMVVAQLDLDPALEIATSDGRVTDGATRKTEWTWLRDFGSALRALDIDGDGLSELLCVNSSYHAWAFDVELRLPKWSLAGVSTSTFEIVDADGDQQLELLIRGANNRIDDLSAYDPLTLAHKWTITHESGYHAGIATGDIDGDGVTEVLLGTKAPGYLQVFDGVTRAREWINPRFEGQFYGPRRGDIDGDGQQELVAISRGLTTGAVRGQFIVMEGFGMDLSVEVMPITLPSAATNAGEFELIDHDGDGDLEVIAVTTGPTVFDFDPTTRRFDDGQLLLASGNNFVKQPICAVDDLDGNGQMDLVMANGRVLASVNIDTSTVAWLSTPLPSDPTEVVLADTDDDPALEIHVLLQNGEVRIFDGASYQQEGALADPEVEFTSLSSATIAGSPVVITGDEEGQIRLHLWVSNQWFELGPTPLLSAQLDGIAVIEPTNWSLVAAGSRLTLFNLLTPVWQTLPFDDLVGEDILIRPEVLGFMTSCRAGLLGFQPR